MSSQLPAESKRNDSKSPSSAYHFVVGFTTTGCAVADVALSKAAVLQLESSELESSECVRFSPLSRGVFVLERATLHSLLVQFWNGGLPPLPAHWTVAHTDSSGRVISIQVRV
jgi:hypothetical protein